MPVDEACRHADLGAAQLVDRLAGHRLLGLIAGPPALVYVRPDGLQRG
jgi:hypothetical protein